VTAKQHLAKALMAQLDDKEKVKEFVSLVKEFGFYDLTSEEDVKLLNGHGELLITLVTYYQLGLLSKMMEVKIKLNKLRK